MKNERLDRRKSIREGEEHHWWPISLAKGWAQPDGRINTVSQFGMPKSYHPKQIAKIRNGHNIIVGGPWNETFEHQFAEPDANFPPLVKWLEALDTQLLTFSARIAPVELDPSRRLKLSQCLASLIVRSPTMRNRIILLVQHFHARSGVENYKVPDHLIAMNMLHLNESFSRSINRSGRFAVLFAGNGEFIFGDGFLHNFPTTWMPEPMNPVCLVPLSPTVTVLFQRPTSMWSEPQAVMMPLAADELKLCNDTIEVYSKDWLYYRTQNPSLEHFRDGKHQEWINHNTPLLQWLKAEVMRFRH